jgi:Cdc6-like AAA superfamily ATPase
MDKYNILDEIILVDRLDYSTILNQTQKDIAIQIIIWFVDYITKKSIKLDDIKNLEIDDFTSTLSKERYTVIVKELDAMNTQQQEVFDQCLEDMYKIELKNRYEE